MVPARFARGWRLVPLVALLAGPGAASATATAWRPVAIADAYGRPLPPDPARRPILVFYEDRGSAHQNDGVKARLGELARRGLGARVNLVAVADLEDWNFWPARPFVRNAVRDESARQKLPIYCDWDGAFGRALDLRHGASNIAVYDRAGRLVYESSGALSTEQETRLLDVLRSVSAPP